MEQRKSGLFSVIILLAIAGSVLSFWSLEHYVAVQYNADTSHSLCNAYSNFNCDAVNQSKWATFLGFPLAGYGLLFYVSILVFGFLQILGRGVKQDVFGDVLFSLSLLASLFSVILFIISKVDIGALCLYCMGMYLVNFCLLISSVFTSRSRGIVSSFGNGLKSLFLWPLFGFGLSSRGGASNSKSYALKSFLLFAVFAVVCLPLSEPVVHALIIRPDEQLPSGLNGEQVKEQWVSDWEKQDVAQLLIKGEEAGALARDYTKGTPGAPVQIVEFFDYECPACRQMYFVLKNLLTKYPNQISITVKNFPLDKKCNPTLPREIHRFACYGSSFARCAGEQGKFWEATDLVFESGVLATSNSQEEVEQALFAEAKSRGIDVSAIQECTSSARYNSKILEDISYGQSLGVQGTPTLWINGKRVIDLSLPALDALVSQILNSGVKPNAPETNNTPKPKATESYGVSTF